MSALTTAGLAALAAQKATRSALSLPLNVKDYGAVGNGTADDTVAIQSVVTAASVAGGTVFFPLGTYKLTASVTWDTVNLSIQFEGEPGAAIVGNFSGALLKRVQNSPIVGVHVIRNLRFQNDHASGVGVEANSCLTFKAENCAFSGPGSYPAVTNRGIITFNSQAATLDTCAFTGLGLAVVAGNATMVLDCDITGCTEGVRHQNLGLIVHGGRYEVNNTAIRLGVDEDGDSLQSSGFDISGLSMESNDWAFDMTSGCASGEISGIQITNNVAGKSGGINLQNATAVHYSGVSFSSGEDITAAGFKTSNDGSCRCIQFDACSSVIDGAGDAWDIPQPTNIFVSDSCNLTTITTKTDADFNAVNGCWRDIILNSTSGDKVMGWRNDTEWNGNGGIPKVGSLYTFTNIGTGKYTLEALTGVTLVEPTKISLPAKATGYMRKLEGTSTWANYGGWTT